MNIKESKLGLISLVSISGAIIKPHLELLKESLENHLKAGDHRILIDLKEAPLIDSAGLELLWDNLMDFRKAGGSLNLLNAAMIHTSLSKDRRYCSSNSTNYDNKRYYIDSICQDPGGASRRLCR